MSIRGQWSSLEPTYTYIQIFPCWVWHRDDSDRCETNKEKWAEAVNTFNINYIWKDRFFDFKDTSQNPVKEIIRYQYLGL